MDTADLQVVQPVKQTRLGKYYLLALIGHGGMGEIFLAKRAGPAGFEKLLVIKRILPHLASNPEFVEMFLDEARVAARLNHPNVTAVYEVGKDGPHYYMAMEYVDGQSLSRLVRESIRQNRFPQPEFFARIISYTLEGLHHAHTLTDHTGTPLGIVHRDVSPQNIMVTYDGGIKLLDFGIAKARTRIVQTQTGAIKGKYSYMSPEQCWGKPLDARSDVFAAGIILFEVCTGRRLFKTDSDLATMKKITEDPIPDPRSINPHLPPPLEAVIKRALEKDPDRRYQSAEAMRNDLEEFLASRTTRLGSVEIGRFMKELFAEHIAVQRKSIQEVLAAGSASLEKPLHGEADESSSVKFEGRLSRPSGRRPAPVIADEGWAATQASVPSRGTYVAEVSEPSAPVVVANGRALSTLTAAAGERTEMTELPSRRRGAFVGLAVGLAIVAVVGVWVFRQRPAAIFGQASKLPTALQATPPGGSPAAPAGGEAGAPTGPEEVARPGAAAVSPAGVVSQSSTPSAAPRWEIHTDPPGASIFLDGEDTGLKTPASLTGIKPGLHRLRLVLPGYVEHGDSWDARPGSERTLRLTLTPLPKPPAPQQAEGPKPEASTKSAKPREAARRGATRTVRRDRPKPVKVVDKPPAQPQPEQAYGTLSLDTRPWSDVYWNGKKLGRTPLIEVKLPAGVHTLRLVNEAKGIKEHYRVQVKPNQHVTKRLGL